MSRPFSGTAGQPRKCSSFEQQEVGKLAVYSKQIPDERHPLESNPRDQLPSTFGEHKKTAVQLFHSKSILSTMDYQCTLYPAYKIKLNNHKFADRIHWQAYGKNRH